MTDNETLQLYWGILHCHVRGDLCHKNVAFSPDEMVELERQIDALYAFARDDRGFDFLAYADHDSMGEMIRRGDAPGSPWHLVKQKACQYADPGSFVPLLGYEYQDGMEYNVYLHRTEQLPLAATWEELMGQVTPGDPGILLAAHNRPSPTDWDFPIHENFRLIEILNEGSVFEHWAGHGLRKGHRAGFIGGSDDHGCHPGRNACTGIWANELTEDAIWDALRARRTVAATGIRPQLKMEINGIWMGGSVEAADTFEVHLHHGFQVQPALVLFISDGELLCQRTPASGEFDLTERFPSDQLAGRRTLYAKVLYPDGNMAFCSPVFLPGLPENVGQADAGRLPRPASPVSPEAATPLRTAHCVEEFGPRIGWHNCVNANPLIPDAFRPMQRIRDMVVHTGPDALLVRANGEIVTGTMDGIVAFDAERNPRTLHLFSEGAESRLITALVEVDNNVFGAGYFADQPEFVTLCGKTPAVMNTLQPIHPYLYADRFVTPRYLASDGLLLACLAERECTVMMASGKIIAFCQSGYPSFPCAVDLAGLDCMVVLGCDGTLVCYDASAAQSAVLRWRVRLPEPRSSVSIMGDEVWCYNRSFHGCYSVDPIRITVLDRRTGALKGWFEPDLMNIRGTSIRPLGEGRFVALHNPSVKGAAAFKKELNLTGSIRVYQ